MPDNQVQLQTTTTDSDIRKSTVNTRQPDARQPGPTPNNNHWQRHPTINSQHPTTGCPSTRSKQQPSTATSENQQSALKNRQSETNDKQLSPTDTPVKTNFQQRIRSIKKSVNFDGNLRKIKNPPDRVQTWTWQRQTDKATFIYQSTTDIDREIRNTRRFCPALLIYFLYFSVCRG